jgi:hypothetical protein
MTGEGQPSEAPNAPGVGDEEQPRSHPPTPEAGRTGQPPPPAEAGGSELPGCTSGASGPMSGCGSSWRNRFVGVSRKSLIKLLALVVGGVVTFLFGVTASELSDYVKRAGNCVDALQQYNSGVAAHFSDAWFMEHNPPDAADQQAYSTWVEKETAALQTYVSQVDSPYNKSTVTCPVNLDRSTEYLNENDVKTFLASYDRMDKCMKMAGCPGDDTNAVADAVTSSAQTLAKEANVVATWNLKSRIQYVFTHLFT